MWQVFHMKHALFFIILTQEHSLQEASSLRKEGRLEVGPDKEPF